MIGEGERGFAVGITGSGKSRLLSYYFATYPGQRVLVDVGDDYELGKAALEDGGACVARDPDRIDWAKRTIRYVPARMDDDEYEQLYSRIWERARRQRGLLVWLDEGEGPTSAHRSPLHLRLAVKQGRKKRLTHLTSTQRPVEVEKALHNQAEHAWVFRIADVDDIALLARRLQLRPGELAGALERLPEHGFLYHRIGQPIVSFPPLDRERLAIAQAHVRIP